MTEEKKAGEDIMVIAPPAADEAEDSKDIVLVEKVEPVRSPEKRPPNSNDRDAALAQVETGKKNSLIKAWEESRKSRAENKAQKKMASISSWENLKQAYIETEMKKLEEELAKKKAEHEERINNKAAMIHKAAEERRAMVEANKGEALLKVEEAAARYRALGVVPKKNGWFRSS